MQSLMKRVTSAAREWLKVFGVPAVVMAAWLAAVVVLAKQVASPVPLEAAIEEVLAAPPTHTASVSSPTASQPMALVHRTSVGRFH